ncbi:unnamed protein product [Mytilus edulis]|uniref:G-protein coupled receptors family 1 profile domain-containing protein n=1 Tax=Mytilus edulis TaxID=6550 RepID=A0A8S3V9K3_MYTED|nr:unnamed protein product [Mytilus edulis]
MGVLNVTALIGNETLEQGMLTFYNNMRLVTGLILYPVVCVVALPANIISILVFTRKKMRSSTSIFLLNLAIIDTITIFNNIIYFIDVLLIEISFDIAEQTFVFFYPYGHYIFNSSMTCTAWLIVAIAIQRYIFVCHSSKAKTICSIPRAIILSIAISLTSFGTSIPYLCRYQENNIEITNKSYGTNQTLVISSLWKNKMFSTAFTSFHYAFRSLIPIILLVVFSLLIVKRLRQCQFRKGKRKTALSLLMVILSFVICATPDTVMSAVLQTGYIEASYLIRGIREIADFLLLVNAGFNFIIYSAFNSLFRKTLKEIVYRKSNCHCEKYRSPTHHHFATV